MFNEVPMNKPQSSSEWRDTAVVPESYDDAALLVGLARDARMKMVDFDWYFSEEEMRRLQRVVYERGRAYTGRFRLFNARMLAAIREALGDQNTIPVLREPARVTLEAEVKCERLNGVFR